MELLRNLGETTRILILLEISLRNHSVQRTIGEALGMTAQGVSEYLRTMQADGLVHIVDGEYRPTFEGVRVLHQRFRDLREFVDRGSKGLSIIEVTAAVAGSAIERGETVGLFMERGDLVAYAGRASPSRGRAITAADGILKSEMRPGLSATIPSSCATPTSCPRSAAVIARPREGDARPAYATRSPRSMKRPTVSPRSIALPARAAVTSMMERPFDPRSTNSRRSRKRWCRTRTPSKVGRYSPSTIWTRPSACIVRRYSETPWAVIPRASPIVR